MNRIKIDQEDRDYHLLTGYEEIFLSALLVVAVCLVSLQSVHLVLGILLINAIYNILKNWKDR